jgi:hypothetical protein
MKKVRFLGRFLVVALLFALSSWLMLRMLPGSLKPIDYMIVGTFATCVSLLAVFLVLAIRSRHVLVTRRRRQ